MGRARAYRAALAALRFPDSPSTFPVLDRMAADLGRLIADGTASSVIPTGSGHRIVRRARRS
jgi:hypothetical protein